MVKFQAQEKPRVDAAFCLFGVTSGKGIRSFHHFVEFHHFDGNSGKVGEIILERR